MNTSPEEHPAGHESAGNKRSKWVFIGFALVAAYFLITEHREHLVALVPFLPWLLFLACPLMHLFHHGGHVHHNHGDQASRDNKETTNRERP